MRRSQEQKAQSSLMVSMAKYWYERLSAAKQLFQSIFYLFFLQLLPPASFISFHLSHCLAVYSTCNTFASIFIHPPPLTFCLDLLLFICLTHYQQGFSNSSFSPTFLYHTVKQRKACHFSKLFPYKSYSSVFRKIE